MTPVILSRELAKIMLKQNPKKLKFDMITTGTRHLKDITDAELTTFVELSGEWGVKKFWGDIKITEIDRLMFDNTICIDYEQDRIRDGEKATSTMFFNYKFRWYSFINYTGTEEQWNSIEKDDEWNKNCPSDMVINYSCKKRPLNK